MPTPTPGQLAYAAYHDGYIPDAEHWPADDKQVQRWEAVGRAVALVVVERCIGACRAQAAAFGGGGVGPAAGSALRCVDRIRNEFPELLA